MVTNCFFKKNNFTKKVYCFKSYFFFMDRSNRLNKKKVVFGNLVDTPIIDQPLPFFDTKTPAGPLTFFKYPRIIIIEQPPDYLKFNTLQKK